MIAEEPDYKAKCWIGGKPVELAKPPTMTLKRSDLDAANLQDRFEEAFTADFVANWADPEVDLFLRAA
jgi:hypothetical protein